MSEKIALLGDSLFEWGDWDEMLQTDKQIINLGVSGETTREIGNRVGLIDDDVSTVIIMGGINDLFLGYTVDTIFSNYKNMIDDLLKRNFKLVVLSTLYVTEMYARIQAKNISKLNKLLEEYAKERSIIYDDLNSSMATGDILDVENSTDGVHLSDIGYEKWAKRLQRYF